MGWFDKKKSNKDIDKEMSEEEKANTVEEAQEETQDQQATAEAEVTEEEESEGFEAKYLETNDKFLRLYSEFENFRRRTAKEKLDLMSNAQGEALKSLLPILDDFERAIINNDSAEDFDALRDGFKLINQKLFGILNQKGVKIMEVEKGSAFDVDLHEAITQIPAPEEGLKGKVIDVIEKGYFINDKVLRYAKVVVGS
jgi:molecular chaperone GrpE